MENINRKKITLLQVIIFNSVFLVILLVILLFKIIPNISFYNEEKNGLYTTSQELNRIKQQGISYNEFIDSMMKNNIKDAYLEALIKTISLDFYNKNLQNPENQGLYEDFIKNKEIEITNKMKERDVSDREKSIQTILPEYNGSSFTENKQALTDFKFINYIESIFYTFNLVSSDSIGISDVFPVENYVTQESENAQQGISSKLYYIPLNLTITGRKTDILDFLHFAENVGAVNIKDGKFSVFADDKLIQNFSTDKEKNSNIYENQIFDIENIKMPQYIDSDMSSTKGDLQEFSNFLKATQGNEKFSADLSLRFYVK